MATSKLRLNKFGLLIREVSHAFDGGSFAGYIGIVVGFNALAMLLISWFVGTRFNLPLVIAISCGAIAGFTVVLELQRQRVLKGVWRFRLSIISCLILMLIAACFFAIVGNIIRANQLGHAANLTLRTKLEELIDGGNAYISTIEGTGVSCDVSRASFSDCDLQKLIQLASELTPGISQTRLLNLEKTSVTDVGLQAVHHCPHLTHLFLPAFQLSNESIAGLVACRNLKYLTLDESKLTSEQVAALRNTLPKLILNGKRWSDRRPCPHRCLLTQSIGVSIHCVFWRGGHEESISNFDALSIALRHRLELPDPPTPS